MNYNTVQPATSVSMVEDVFGKLLVWRILQTVACENPNPTCRTEI